jgi:hypothetical protein
MPAKLKFKLVYCSSEDSEFPATELNAHSPHTVGWQELTLPQTSSVWHNCLAACTAQALLRVRVWPRR